MDSKEKWNQKYSDRLTDQILPEPNRRLVELSAYLDRGSAIDLASGLGGNSIYLAEKGYEVTAIDISEVAIQYVREQADHHKLNITAAVADLTKETTALSGHKYNFAVMTYYLDRSLFPLIKQILSTGGYLFFETFYKNGSTGKQQVSNQYKLNSNELLNEFKEWKILFFEENEQEGRQTIFCQKTTE
ncbi:class I SAM-dependent methyltransferase [Mesobacillus selenatarsenatis]|uniref:Methyltransferase domain-containing protein n=1 Tax=Mesobacillus selenatarsenatis TaxID=388741 RepID=A0A846TFX1_9BACI|nr:methyltransferase domain-containing protein [Mesobacillus selenatarsenatis]NKE04317.1 methyltransferase domain-containing protein [Mesobacillus selenatarsenatis]